MRSSHRPSGGASAGGFGPGAHRRGSVPQNFPSVRPQFQNGYQRDRPPGVAGPFGRERPNFVVDIRCDRQGFQKPEVEALIANCNPKPDNFHVNFSGKMAASLYFRQWIDARASVVNLWKLRLEGVHVLSPSLSLSSKALIASDKDELEGELRTLFLSHAKSLIDSKAATKWQMKLSALLDEIAKVSAKLGGKNSLWACGELVKEKEALKAERDLVWRRIKEFKSAISCIIDHLEGKKLEECDREGVEIFRLGDELKFNWSRLHRLMMRECQRLEVGLPIYAYRKEILSQINSHQVMVLVGETGSGKSTQLAQYLADSVIAASESIVCTQPRKIAAISLAHRVEEETRGCYEDRSIQCCQAFSSDMQFHSNVVYMTDNCLLQHYMKDKNLSGISCIIVDEAHERSLNTDLLLALIKELLCWRHELRLVIMSATANADQISNYFWGCGTFRVEGRSFPVDIKYTPFDYEGTSSSLRNNSNSNVASYVSNVLSKVTEIHKYEKEGTILAFLTSQNEVEWACERFQSPTAIALPLHGKLSHDEQLRVFQNYPRRRKVIFATNLAETSLTIPGVKFVVDSGMVKESRFEPGTGMNVLRVSRVSQSSADQRAGRAGRTEPGTCYRLYSKHDFELMLSHQEPEVRRVHLGIAVLRILSLGVQNVQGFDFIDAPSPQAIKMAIRNLIQLGAITSKDHVYELTEDGRYLVKMGIEPRLGKLILGCFSYQLKREGLVLAAVMANSSSIFCRVGNDEEKLKSDCLKVQFCHPDGDLFTLLSVYKEWEGIPREKRGKWCWENSINAKSMRRCEDTVQELDRCLEKELMIITPSYWKWDPHVPTEHDKTLKKVVLSSLAENVAMFSGFDRLGYEVALTGQHVQLHPSCSLLIFGQKPSWVVFGELLSISNQYLVCVTAFDFEALPTLSPSPLFDIAAMESRKLHVKTMTGFGSTMLKKLCGKFNHSLLHLVSGIQLAFGDTRIGVEVNVDENEIRIFASAQHMEKVTDRVIDMLDQERRWLENECLEKCLYHAGPGTSPSLALFGSGGEIKHLELNRRCLSVDISHPNAASVDDKELLMFIEKGASGISAVHKCMGPTQDYEDKEKWGRVTFLNPEAARKAVELNGIEFNGSVLKLCPSRTMYGGDHKMFSFPAVKARVSWPRRCSKGLGIVRCARQDLEIMVNDFSNLLIGGKYIRSEVSTKYSDCVVISGLDRESSETEVLDVLRHATERNIQEFFLVRGDPVDNMPLAASEEALLKEILPLMPKTNPHSTSCRVQVFQPKHAKEAFIHALITFDGRLHLEAAKALENIEGKVLPGCLPWQKIKCQRLFYSTVSCPASVFFVIQHQLETLLASLRRRKGAECRLDRNENGSYRVKVTANATRTVAELRRPLEDLMRGTVLDDPCLIPAVLQLLFSRDGIQLMHAVQRDTGTYILFDRHSLSIRIFGPREKIPMAHTRFVRALLALHGSKQLEISLRGSNRPPALMKQMVDRFGPDLHGLKEKVPDATFSLNIRRQVISICGNKESKQKVEAEISAIAQTSGRSGEPMLNTEVNCPICLCEIDDAYRLENCGHLFCISCLLEQCDSVTKSHDGFPMRCAHEGCRAIILLTDLKTLLTPEKLEELFRASLSSFVTSSAGAYRFCPSPDCPSVYHVAGPEKQGDPYQCEACYAVTCTSCHMEYHPFISCEKYREYKEHPDLSLMEWCKGKENVKSCPVCSYTIEKVDGCNHVECKCGKHICWVCLEAFPTSDDCYNHLRSVHKAIT